MKRSVPLVAALLALVAPHMAAAHAAFDGGAMLGDASAHVELTGAPVPAALVPMQLVVRTDAVGAQLRLVSPDGDADAWEDVAAGSVIPVMFAAPGAWTVELRAGQDRMALTLDVWPPAEAFLEPASATARDGVAIEGAEIDFRARLVDATGVALAPPPDVRALVHAPEGPVEIPVEVEGDELVVARAWTQGEHRIEILSESLGLAPDARPAMGLLVVPAEQASVYGLDNPAAAGASWWGPVAIVGVALAAAFTTARLWRRSCSR